MEIPLISLGGGRKTGVEGRLWAIQLEDYNWSRPLDTSNLKEMIWGDPILGTTVVSSKPWEILYKIGTVYCHVSDRTYSNGNVSDLADRHVSLKEQKNEAHPNIINGILTLNIVYMIYQTNATFLYINQYIYKYIYVEKFPPKRKKERWDGDGWHEPP